LVALNHFTVPLGTSLSQIKLTTVKLGGKTTGEQEKTVMAFQ